MFALRELKEGMWWILVLAWGEQALEREIEQGRKTPIIGLLVLQVIGDFCNSENQELK